MRFFKKQLNIFSLIVTSKLNFESEILQKTTQYFFSYCYIGVISKLRSNFKITASKFCGSWNEGSSISLLLIVVCCLRGKKSLTLSSSSFYLVGMTVDFIWAGVLNLFIKWWKNNKTGNTCRKWVSCLISNMNVNFQNYSDWFGFLKLLIKKSEMIFFIHQASIIHHHIKHMYKFMKALRYICFFSLLHIKRIFNPS